MPVWEVLLASSPPRWRFEAIESYSMLLRKFDHSKINAIFRQLWHKTVSVVAAGAARWKPGRPPKERRRAYLRYVGQGQEVCVDLPNRDLEAGDPEMLQLEFESEYNRLGFYCTSKRGNRVSSVLPLKLWQTQIHWRGPRERLHAKQKVVRTVDSPLRSTRCASKNQSPNGLSLKTNNWNIWFIRGLTYK